MLRHRGPHTLQHERSRAGALVVAAFGLTTLLFSGQFPPFANPNELSRLETVYAAVEHGTLSIDRAIPILGDHEDKSVSGGRFYSNKAPGLALAAIPVYRLLRIFLPRPTSAGATIFVLLRILVVSSVCWIALALFRRRLGSGPCATMAAFAAAFGTPYLFYARTFFSHAWTAALLWIAWELVRVAEEREHRSRVELLRVGAGFLAMWSAITEYPLAVLVLALAWRVCWRRSVRPLAWFALGAAVPVAVLAAYNAACFGSPFVLSSAREASSLYARLDAGALFGFSLPRPAVAWRYLADPSRGMLLFSPFLLWAAPGFWRGVRGGEPDARFAAGAALVYFVVMTGYANWHGGWSLGDRYLLPGLFLAAAALPDALRSPWSRVLFVAAAVCSAAVHLALTLSWPHFPPGFAWPAGNGSLWFLARGWVAPGFPGRWGMAPPVLAGLATLVAGVASVRSAGGGAVRTATGAAVGVLLALALVLARPQPPFGARLWRAAVFGAYSGRDPERRELRDVALSARDPGERRQAMGAWRIYGPPRR